MASFVDMTNNSFAYIMYCQLTVYTFLPETIMTKRISVTLRAYFRSKLQAELSVRYHSDLARLKRHKADFITVPLSTN